MGVFSFLLRTSRKLLLLSVLAGAVSGLSSVALVVLIHRALTDFKYWTSALILGFCAFCLIRLVTGFASQVMLFRLSQGAILDLRIRLSSQIMAAPLRHLEEVGPHRLLATLTDDVLIISNAFMSIPILFVSVAMVAGCLIYLGWLSPTVLVLLFGFMALWIASYRLVLARAGRYLRLAREEMDELFKHFRALTRGIKELKLHYRRGVAFQRQFLQATALSLHDHNIKGETIYVGATNWARLLVFVFIGLVMFAVSRFQNLDLTTLTGIVLTSLYITAPLDVVLNQLPILSRANVAMQKVEALGLKLAAAPHEGGSAGEVAPKAGWSRLELAGVTHRYYHEREERSFVLGPIDLIISPGELIFLVGGNGSGKTTLAKLLTGLYRPEGGEIRFDGELIDDANLTFYRQHFSVVFSDFYLFENLLGLSAPALDERARAYLERLQLEHKVQVESGRLSTTELSQGQRKRLALLTAYLEDRPIYLFDEWAADQDPVFKSIFYRQILPELKARGKAVFVISHDDQYYHLADRVIKIDYGKIVADQLTPATAPVADETYSV